MGSTTTQPQSYWDQMQYYGYGMGMPPQSYGGYYMDPYNQYTDPSTQYMYCDYMQQPQDFRPHPE